MNQLIHISPFDISQINRLSIDNNSKYFIEHIGTIDYHSIMFSTLYQSGVNYFEIDKNDLPESIINNEFWNSKIVNYNDKALNNAIEKAVIVLDGRFDIELDNKYNVPQYYYVVDYLSKLFYSLETGTPFINPEYILSKDFDLLEKRMDKTLWKSLKNLNSLIVSEKVQTLTPEYSVLKKDVKRFEDICYSNDFKVYSDSLQLLPYSMEIKSIQKDVSVNTLKLFNKFSNNFKLKESAFNFIKFNKKVVDNFIGKIPANVGDFVINSIEKLATDKKQIFFHEVHEAKYSTLICNRVEELVKEVGNEKFREIVAEWSKNKNSR